jgi:hypothetical protein
MLDGQCDLNLCDNPMVMVSMEWQGKLWSDVVMCDGMTARK